MSYTRTNTNRSAPVTILQCWCRIPYSLMTVRAVDCRQFLIPFSLSSRGLADPVTAVLVSKIHAGSFPRDLFWSNSFGGGAKKKSVVWKEVTLLIIVQQWAMSATVCLHSAEEGLQDSVQTHLKQKRSTLFWSSSKRCFCFSLLSFVHVWYSGKTSVVGKGRKCSNRQVRKKKTAFLQWKKRKKPYLRVRDRKSVV